MPGLIPENILEDILGRVDIVEVISGYIPLKKAGRNFKACCPFHHEKTPSFMVSPERQIFHCFGCNESGNAFKFLMRYERLEFPEAVEILAKKSGVILPERQTSSTVPTSLSAQLLKLNELAAMFYQNNLGHGEGIRAREYLKNRGIDASTAAFFKIGLATDKWDGLINYFKQKNINLSTLEKAGLVLPREKGGYYDRFRSRIIFPVFDIKSRVLGFGGRIFEQTDTQETAKYINSPETPIYTKGRNLYGLNFSKEAIRDSNSAIIVEGYLDFIIPFSQGLHNVVASLGTALTAEQVNLLKRFTNNVVMVYDGDDAGQMATLRSLDILIEEGMNVKVVSLPKNMDPDTYVRKFGAGEFKNKISAALSLFDFKLNVLKSQNNVGEIEGKADVCREMLSTINKFKNAVLKSEYVKKLAQDLSVDEPSLFQELAKFKESKFQHLPASVAKKDPGIDPSEKLLIKLMLEESELIQQIRGQISPSEFRDGRISKIVSLMFELIEQGKAVETSKLINYFPDEDMSQFICESVFAGDAPVEDKEKVAQDCIRLIKRRKMVFLRQRLEEEIRAAERVGDENKLDKLKKEFCELVKKER